MNASDEETTSKLLSATTNGHANIFQKMCAKVLSSVFDCE